MAALVSLSLAKQQIRVRNDAEDELIQTYIDAALEHIKNFLNKDVIPNNAATRAAALLIIAGLYMNREATGEKKIEKNQTVEDLLYPYRGNLGI